MNIPGLNFSITSFLKSSDLKSRLSFTFFIALFCRLGSYIPIPGVNFQNASLFEGQANGVFFSMFDMFSGGSLSRVSIFALGLGPYITASILFQQLLPKTIPYFMDIKKQGEFGKVILNKYTRYVTIILAIAHAFYFASNLEVIKDGVELIMFPGVFFKFLVCIILCATTMLIMWFGEQITARGIGNGSSIIIFVGIVANLPSSLYSIFHAARSGTIGLLSLVLIIFMIIAIFFITVFFEKVERPVPVHYSRHQIGMGSGDKNSNLPIKLNPAGVMPPIFAGNFIGFIPTCLNFLGMSKYTWAAYILSNFKHGTAVFAVLYAIMIFICSFAYSSIFFDAEETADNLKKSGGYLTKCRPGQSTVIYLENLVFKISVFGGIYLAFICTVPEFLMMKSLVTIYFGGTSLLIIVGVSMDFIERVKASLVSIQYEKVLKKGYGGRRL